MKDRDDQEVKAVEDKGQEFDQQVEQDIRMLRRSSRWFASFGILAFLLLTCLVIFSLFDQSFSIDLGTPYVDIGFVKSTGATIYTEPGEQGQSLKTMPQGAGLFVLTKADDWFKVQSNNLIGWMKKDDLETKSDREKRKAIPREMPVRISDVNWFVDEIDNFTIVGQIENLTDRPIESVKVIVDFYDADSNLVHSKSSLIRTNTSFRIGHPQNFNLSGKHEKKYMGVDYRIANWR